MVAHSAAVVRHLVCLAPGFSTLWMGALDRGKVSVIATYIEDINVAVLACQGVSALRLSLMEQGSAAEMLAVCKLYLLECEATQTLLTELSLM